nr:MBL fold metallo-hydrolase [Haloferula luteola]
MAGHFELLFLGTGTSVGVPVIGCKCEVCRSKDPRNRRTRSSILLQSPTHHVLVDSGPDLREQALREGIERVDAVLYTHAHVDHVVGFDELRAFCWHRSAPLPLHASPFTLRVLQQMFPWAFDVENTYPGYIKPLPVPFEPTIHLGDITATPLPLFHGAVETHGFLIDYPGAPSIGYLPDVKALHESSITALQGVDLLIVDSLRPREHPTHLSNAEALSMIEQLGAAQAWLTHLGHENEHALYESHLPRHVRVAYDGLKLQF